MKTWVLASFTLRETIRSRTMIAGLVVSLMYLAIVPVLSTTDSAVVTGGLQVGDESGRDFLNFALNGLNFIAMIMAILTTLGAIYTEIDKGTIYTVVTKPIKRWQVVVGKWAGHVLLMGGYVLVMGLALWMSVVLGSGTIVWSFFPSIALICVNVIAMVSLTLLFSTFVPIIANAIFVFLLYIFTNNLGIINAVSESSDSLLVDSIANGLKLILPVGEVSGVASNLIQDTTIANADGPVYTPSGWFFFYEVIYIGLVVLLASAIFRKRDLR